MAEPDLRATIEKLGGVATRAQLLKVFDRPTIELAVLAGSVRRIARGRYATHDLDAAVEAARVASGVLSGLSAAQWWGWSLKRAPSQPEVTVPRNRSRAVVPEGVVLLRRDLPEGAVVDGLVTSRAQTVVDCARTLPFDEALSVADSALRDPKVTRKDLLEAVDASSRSGRGVVRRVVDAADGDAANAFESCVRAAAMEVDGLSLATQVQVGSVGWADLVDVHLRIVVECDSWAFHSGEDLFRRDVRRYTDMVRRDWLVVRFVWEDAMVRPDRIREVLTDVVALRHRQAHSSA